MSIQAASNELHRAFIVTGAGHTLAGAKLALESQKMALKSKSKHSKAIAERASQHVVTVLDRMDIEGITDAAQRAEAEKVIKESMSLSGEVA